MNVVPPARFQRKKIGADVDQNGGGDEHMSFPDDFPSKRDVCEGFPKPKRGREKFSSGAGID